MDRRGFVRTAAAGVALAVVGPAAAAPRVEPSAPLPPARTPRIGVLGEANPLSWVFQRDAVELECRWAQARGRRLGDLARELLALDVDVVVAVGLGAARAAAAATAALPIVFVVPGDPVEARLVASLDRPGGNVTGVSVVSEAELAARRLALLRETVPGLARLGVLGNPDNTLHSAALAETRRAADRCGVEVHVVRERRAAKLDDPFMHDAFRAIDAGALDALLVLPDALFSINAGDLVALARAHRLPALYPARTFTDRGGLMALHGNSAEVLRCVSALVGAVLGGAHPATLPVQRLHDLVLTVNLPSAAALDLTIPPRLRAGADASTSAPAP
jgi:putative ABC transport system substrate-binding protein